jgi:hypothetical protein
MELARKRYSSALLMTKEALRNKSGFGEGGEVEGEDSMLATVRFISFTLPYLNDVLEEECFADQARSSSSTSSKNSPAASKIPPSKPATSKAQWRSSNSAPKNNSPPPSVYACS